MSHTCADPRIGNGLKALKGALVATAAVAALASVAPVASAQDELEVVVVTGYRASLESALNSKRASAEMVDAINAEDIAAFPDANLAESLQRLPGVSVDRENGEGRTITVRGLSADFTRVTLNGLEALSTAGATDSSGTSPNRSRQFDFNTFASELFSGLKVHKSNAADTDEGSLGATVELQTGHPFDFGNKSVISAQNAWYEAGKPFNPRITGLWSHTFLDGHLGVLGSVAYNMRHQKLDSYQRSPGQSDFLYRQAVFGGSYIPTGATTILNRAGFSAPAGTSCTGGTSADNYNGVIPNFSIPNATYCAALSGSNADAYATITGGQRGYLQKGTAGKTASSGYAGQAYLTMIPGLATLNDRDLYQSRIGLTGSVQWQVDDKTMVTLDAVFASTYQNSTNYQVSGIGLNRSSASTQMSAVPAALTTSSTVAQLTTFESKLLAAYTAYTKCTANSGSATAAAVTCSYNKAAPDLYTYYTNGYGTATTVSAASVNALNSAYSKLISFVGKPTTKIVKAVVDTSGTYPQATYLQLANMDFSSRADQVYYTTQFGQASLSANRDFTDKFKVSAQVGMSQSRNTQVGYLAGFDRLDSGTYDATTDTCTGCFVYDATQGGNMPILDYGFDPSLASNWDFVKGDSVLRHYQWNTVNKFRSAKIDLSYDALDQLQLKFGFVGRIYDFKTQYALRVVKDVINPSIDEINAGEGTSTTVADLGKTVSFGTGMDLPSGTATSLFVPDLKKMKSFFHLDCNCVTDYGDFTISGLNSYASTTASGQNYGVSEHDKAYYLQADFHDIMVLGRELRGNVGLRYVTTGTDSTGHNTMGGAVKVDNSYDSILPSLNLNYFLSDDMILRASTSKVISRPQLATLAPSITSMSIPTDSNTTTATMTMGNPYLKPYSGTTIDVGYEWYFDKGAVFSVAAFSKFIKDVPQTVVNATTFDKALSPDAIATLVSGLQATATTSNQTQIQYEIDFVNNGGAVNVTQATNGPGGVLEGLEFTYQQTFTFLPAPFDGLGINANYTMIHSLMHYIVNTNPYRTSNGPWMGASPNSYNLTLFYDGKDWQDRSWSGRISFAYRSKYVSQYPIATGDNDPGYTDSPLVNDFVYSKSTLNVDTSFTYDLSEMLQLRVDALNLTNQTDNRFAYKMLAASAVSRYAATGRQVFVGLRLKY